MGLEIVNLIMDDATNRSHTSTRTHDPVAQDLCVAKATLLRFYNQEQRDRLYQAKIQRATAERRCVGALIRYRRSKCTMNSGEARLLQGMFQKDMMAGQGQIWRGYLLGMYLRELN